MPTTPAHTQSPDPHAGHHHGSPSDNMKGLAKDPVCGMTVDPATAKHRTTHDSANYFFCSGKCKEKFEADPAAYLGAKPKKVEGPKDAIYTCPMHPQIRQIGPGSCPICGMALEPAVVTAETGPSAELTDMTRRFWIALGLSVPVFILEMGGHLVNLHMWLGTNASGWIQFALATPVVLWAGWPFFVRAGQSLVTRNLNMFTLIAMGTGVAWCYSVIATVLRGIFPATFRDADGSVAIYFEAAAVITVLVLLGQVLELRAREQTGGAIRALLDLAPKTARRLRADGSDEDVALEDVVVGDRLRVRPGEKVPVDGELIEGRSSLDESMITGESMPVTKEAGAKLIGGTLNQSGGFIMRAAKVGNDTVLARIVQMVAEAQRSRAPIQRLADNVAGWFVPVVILTALLAFAAWGLWGPEPRFAHGLVAAVAVLIIVCPCALGLATPMSIMVGIGRGAHMGILIKNAEALERFEKIDTLVVDKTGTLTEGKPKVVGVKTLDGGSESDLIRLAASLERGSEHPLAAAIVASAHHRNISLSPVGDFDSPVGKGVTGTVQGRRLIIGNDRIMLDAGLDASALAKDAEVLPEDNSKVVEKLKAEGRIVAMAGDGVNNALALAAAGVGIAIGTETDVAIESAGVTLLQGDLQGIARARLLSRATMSNIRQNHFFAFIYNAAGALYPVFGLLLSPVIAAAAMGLSFVSVVLNALRLRNAALGVGTAPPKPSTRHSELSRTIIETRISGGIHFRIQRNDERRYVGHGPVGPAHSRSDYCVPG